MDPQTPRQSPRALEVARELRRRQTPAEALLWNLIRDRRHLGFKFRRQHRFGSYVADFYCHEARLIVELDGGIHDEPEIWKKDRWREENLEALRLRVIRISNELVLERPEQALERIRQAIEGR